MTMPKLYADTPVRRALQVAGDVGLVLWVWLWVVVARHVRDATLELRTPGHQDRRLGLRSGRPAARRGEGRRHPAGGRRRAEAVHRRRGAADGLAGAGRAQVQAVESLAHWLGLAVALIPILVLLWVYLPPRLAFVRRATAGRRFLDAHADLDLFALRAMAHQPLHVLARLDDDPAGAWRRGDRAVIDRLAALELRSVGLRAPRSTEAGRPGVAG